MVFELQKFGTLFRSQDFIRFLLGDTLDNFDDTQMCRDTRFKKHWSIVMGIGYIPSQTNLVPDAALASNFHCNLISLFLTGKYFWYMLLDIQQILGPVS
jgi:hypothetical protein